MKMILGAPHDSRGVKENNKRSNFEYPMVIKYINAALESFMEDEGIRQSLGLLVQVDHACILSFRAVQYFFIYGRSIIVFRTGCSKSGHG